MDILHPQIVHIPIGLLTFYFFLEAASLLKVFRKPLYISKLLLVCSGTMGAFAARIAGEHDEELFQIDTKILEFHEELSLYVVIVFGILSLSYVFEMLITKKMLKSSPAINFFINPYIRLLFAAFGFILLTVVGALGGALVHGPNADPMIRLVTGLLNLR